jgi:aryl-alcohol dehydrogenase-like predicted oxidoreductase
MKIALGTVQFGLNYGVANQAGRVQFEEVKLIISQAADQGVDTLDTAIAYGESENTLGLVGVDNWNVVTKLPAVPPDCADVAKWVSTQIAESINRLGVSQLHGVLLHHPHQLLEAHGKQLSVALQHQKAMGLTRRIGVSIYSANELSPLISAMPCDLVQAPLNILDRQLVDSGWAKRLKDQDIELHVRSAFLQGLLLMPAHKRPVKFLPFNHVWSEWSRWLDVTGLTPLQACLGYVLGIAEVDKVVVGIDSAAQFNDILRASHARLSNFPNWQYPVDTDLINPGRWSAL